MFEWDYYFIPAKIYEINILVPQSLSAVLWSPQNLIDIIILVPQNSSCYF